MGNACNGLCKSKKGSKASPEEMEKFVKQLEKMTGVKKVEDLIQKEGLTKMFDQYVEQNFDMKNLTKYMEDEEGGIFTFDFLQKLFKCAYVFMYIIHDKTTRDLVKQRQEYLRNENTEGYKKIVKQMREMEMPILESTLAVTKEKVQIIDRNFQKTQQHHLRDPQKKKLFAQIQESSKQYFKNYKAQMIMQMRNLHQMNRREALAIQKQLQSIQIDLIRNLYENIPKEQRAEEQQLIEPMLQDTLFIRTGCDTESLDIVFTLQRLDQDPEFKEMQEQS